MQSGSGAKVTTYLQLNAEVKNDWSYTSSLRYALLVWTETNLPSHLRVHIIESNGKTNVIHELVDVRNKLLILTFHLYTVKLTRNVYWI